MPTLFFLIHMLTLFKVAMLVNLKKNKSLHMLHEHKTQFDFGSFVHSEYSHGEYDNYNNPGKNDYSNVNVDYSYYREPQFAFK